MMPEEVLAPKNAIIMNPVVGLSQRLLQLGFVIYVAWTFFVRTDPFMREVVPTSFRSFWASSGGLNAKKAEVEQGLVPSYCDDPHYH